MGSVIQNFDANIKRLSWKGFGQSWRKSDLQNRGGYQSLIETYVSQNVLPFKIKREYIEQKQYSGYLLSRGFYEIHNKRNDLC